MSQPRRDTGAGDRGHARPEESIVREPGAGRGGEESLKVGLGTLRGQFHS